MTTEQQPEAPAVPGDCDAAEWGGAPTMLDGQCRCLVCGRCGHHTGNAHQGHYWNLCKVAHGMREPHFCCPDPAFGCELEPAPVPLVMPADEFAAVEAVAAALDRESLREIIVAAGKPLGGLGRATAWEITDAIWPLLEHAQAAATGSHEGVRLWMQDCGELVTKHRARAEAAERKLAEIAEHCRLRMNSPGRSGMTMAAAGLILGIAEGSSEKEAAQP